MKQEALERNQSPAAAPLAIIGIGCLFPQSEDRTAYWATVREGIDAISDIPASHWRVADYHDPDPKTPDMTYGKRGGFLSPVSFNPMEFNIPPTTLEAIDTSQLLGLVAAGQALKDAGYGPEKEYDRNRVSVILGVTGTLELVVPLASRLGHPHWRKALKEAGLDDSLTDEVVHRIADSYVPWQENSFPGLLGNVVAGRISKQFDLGGTNCVVDAACASSFSALHLAGLELATGKSDMVVTGGIDTFNDIFMYMCFSKTPALSPTGNAKPFDAAGDGTILGEGLGIVVLKRLADAERDGDRIYAVIKGVGSSSDGKGEAIYTPSSQGQKKAILDACRQAGVTPDSIGLVEAHGTGTKVGDAVEVSALREIYGESERPWCALGSVKSQIGHTKAAAGAAGLIKAALALYHKVIPPTIKISTPLKEVSQGKTPFYIATEKRPWVNRGRHPRRAAVSAFGFGGSNFHTILEEYQPSRTRADWDGQVQILPFAAATPEALRQELSAFPADISWQELRARAAALRSAFNASAPCRLVLVVDQKTDLATLIKNAAHQLSGNAASQWSTPDGAFYAAGATSGSLAMLFPGQGAQYPGMLRDQACRFPQLLETLTAAEQGFHSADGALLTDLIYPPAPFSADARQQQESELRATQHAQPAIGAVSLGALRVLESFGITPQLTAGHSYGELTALCAAGRLDENSFHTLSRLRGQLMAAGQGDKGSMLAVSAPLATLEQLIAEEQLELVIANRNAPNQAVLSGASAEIERAAAACGRRQLSCTRLPVAAAFHSSLVADAAQPFLAALNDIPLAGDNLPVYANSTAAPYPGDAAQARKLLAEQLARPVEFVAQIEAMYAAGARTFLEVGPGARLSGLVKAILGERDYTVTAVDASAGKRSGLVDLARCLAQLAALGYPVRLERWEDAFQPPVNSGRKPAMTVPICGANYVAPRKPVNTGTREPGSITAGNGDKGQVKAGTRSQGQGANDLTRPQSSVPAFTPFNPVSPSTAAPASPASRDALAESLRVTREGMALLQRMQEETAQLHRRFLEGQESTSKTIQALLQQQQLILQGGVLPAVPLAPAAPAPQAAAVATAPAPAHGKPETMKSNGGYGGTGNSRQSQASGAHVTTTLLAVVSEKTGYPVEMLELEMGMDADLGIDSIKRVEILSALQERLPGSPVIGPEQLGTLNTLGDIAQYLGTGTGHGGDGGTGNGVRSQASSSHVTETLLAVVSEKTGYPVEMLELEMGMDADLGIDSIKRVEILSALQERLPGSPVIGPEQLGTLNTLGDIAEYLGTGTGNGGDGGTGNSGQPHTSAAHVTETLLAVVSEKTGYPVEMLELEMGMDADLGIDSIKRVEILSALQERLPGSPVIGPEQLGTLNTLGDIAEYLGTGTGNDGDGGTENSGQPHTSAAHVTETLLAVVSEKTGYPVEMLELEMGMDADLGIDSIKRVEILSALQERLPGSPAIGPEQLGTLNTLGDIAEYLGTGNDAPSQPSAAEPVAEPPMTAGAPLNRSTVMVTALDGAAPTLALDPQGTIWVSDDGSELSARLCSRLSSAGKKVRLVRADQPDSLPEEEIAALVIIAPAAGTDDTFLEDACLLARQAAAGLSRSAGNGGALFATVSRLDGAFGFGSGTTLQDPLSGGLAGLSKTAAREWPAVICRAIDLAPFQDGDSAAGALAEELFRQAPLETGLSPNGRCTLTLTDLPTATPSTPPLQKGDVVVVTGGGRGVTAATAIALARAYRPRLVLLGRSLPPQAEPDWLQPLKDEGSIKRGILEHASEKPHPREIEERYRAIVAGRELTATLERIQAVGGEARYCAVDIRDPQAVADLMQEIRHELGPIRGIVHGAGVLADRLIVDKTREQFRQVYATKVAGLRSLLQATQRDELAFLALFGSTTGRFGRSGQVDYAVANEVLNKLAQAELRHRPACRTVCLNWGPWDGGMVTPALKKVFEQEGIGLIGLEAGGQLLVDEIADRSAPTEVVVLADKAGQELTTPQPAAPSRPLSEAFSLKLTVDDYPFIRSHVIDGRAVLPMAMIMEWLAHGALHGNPGLRFHGFNDLRICKGVIFDQTTACTLTVLADKARKHDSLYAVAVQLTGSTPDGRSLLHASAEILLANKLPEGIRSIVDLPGTPYAPSGAIYDRERLFHGPDMHGIEQVGGCSAKGITALVKAAPQPSSWLKQPLRNSWLTDPLVVDSAFQLMILWSFERFGSGSLPSFAGRYRQFQESFPRDGAQIVIRVTAENEHKATADMEFLDRSSGKLIARLEGYECVIDASLQRAFRRNQLSQPGCVELEAA